MRTAEDDKLIDTVSRELYERVGKAPIFTLPWAAQVVLIVFGAQGIFDNGGSIYFFAHDWETQPPYSVFSDAFRAIGADESADCIEVAGKLFPVSDPHLHCEARRTYMREHCMKGDLTDNSSILVKLGDRVIDHSDANFTLLAQYIRQHLEEIRKVTIDGK